MKHRRLPWLLVVMVGMIALRWFDRPREEPAAPASAAMVRERAAVAPSAARVASADEAEPPFASTEEDEQPRNAFAVRQPPAPPAPPPVAAPPAPKAYVLVGPPAPVPEPPPPPPPPPPLSVIGTWEDERGFSVFIAGPNGTAQGRRGDVLFAQYRVVAANAREVSLQQLSPRLDFRLTVPASPK